MTIEEQKAQMEAFEKKVTESMTEVLEKHVPVLIQKEVAEKLAAAVKDLDLSVIKTDAKFPLGISDEEKAHLTHKQKVAKFIKGIYLKDIKLIEESGSKGMTEGSDSGGGFLVPEEFAAEIDRIMPNVGLIRKLSRRIPMGSDTLNMPILGSAVSVEWVGEANEGSESNPTFKNVKLMAKTALGLTPLSNELLADANVNIVDFLMEIFAEALATAEDAQGFNGTGAPFTGLLVNTEVNQVTAASGHDTGPEFDLDDYRDCITPIKRTILAGCVWVMSPSQWANVQKLQEGSQHIVNFTNNNNVLSNQITSGALVPSGMLWDRPVYESDAMPAASAITASVKGVIFGNFRYFYFGDRQQMTFDISKEASMSIGGTVINAFASNQSIIRVTERVALAVGVPAAFTVLKAAAS